VSEGVAAFLTLACLHELAEANKRGGHGMYVKTEQKWEQSDHRLCLHSCGLGIIVGECRGEELLIAQLTGVAPTNAGVKCKQIGQTAAGHFMVDSVAMNS
jgi:hypothetical protein